MNRLKPSLLIKVGTIKINTFLPTRNKLVYSCSMKIHALGFNEPLESSSSGCGSIFHILLFVERFSLQKVVEMLEEVVDSWRKVRWIWQMRQNFIAQLVQLFSVGCATCSLTLSWGRIGPFLLTNASCRHCSFWCIPSICWVYFSGVMVVPGFRNL